MIRLGLFEQLFWRVMLLLISVPMLLLIFGHLYLQGRIYDSWRQDLRQEAGWTARHWTGAVPYDRLASAWRATHDNVRLTVTDEGGHMIADSHPEFATEAASSFGLHGSAPVRLNDGRPGVLTLSRPQRFVIPVALDLKLLGGLLGIIAISIAVFYPMVRKLTVTFSRLSDQARRVADGRFGETLDPGDQRELGDLVAAFNEMSLRLEAQDIRKRRLIADVSHELRSPMARLRALGETIARHPKEAKTYVAQIESEVALMDRLVGDMLETARFEEGRAEMHPVRVQLAAWAADAFSRSRHRIEQADVACAVAIEGDATASIDPQRMVQVVGALVENALTAVQGRADPAIGLALKIAPDAWTLEVSDNGRGVPAEDLPHVFDRFFRVETHRARSTGGAGLGLSIARSIVEAHGGTIAMSSTVGQGTTVTVRVPTVS